MYWTVRIYSEAISLIIIIIIMELVNLINQSISILYSLSVHTVHSMQTMAFRPFCYYCFVSVGPIWNKIYWKPIIGNHWKKVKIVFTIHSNSFNIVPLHSSLHELFEKRKFAIFSMPIWWKEFNKTKEKKIIENDRDLWSSKWISCSKYFPEVWNRRLLFHCNQRVYVWIV